jgi:prophage tail gpP-like protein
MAFTGPSEAGVSLIVNDFVYRGWKSISVSRGIEVASASFDLGIADKWSDESGHWPILQGDDCELRMNGELVISGYIDQRNVSFGADDHSINVSGRCKASALIDCSFPRYGEFNNIPLPTLVSRLCEPYGVRVLFEAKLAMRRSSHSRSSSWNLERHRSKQSPAPFNWLVFWQCRTG